jgi:vacuolar protein sorting-associated protein 33A
MAMLIISFEQDEDPTTLHITLPALTALTQLYGPIPRITGKGNHAHRFARMFIHHLSTLPSSSSTSPGQRRAQGLLGESTIDGMVIIDRKVDMVTPLLTQLTYEGLIDECMGLKNSHVEVPQALLAPATAPASASGSSAAQAPVAPVVAGGATLTEKLKKHPLKTSTDPLLGQLRDLNFQHVGRTLSRIARRLDNDYKVSTIRGLCQWMGY